MTLFKKVFQQNAKPVGDSAEPRHTLLRAEEPEAARGGQDLDAFDFEDKLDVYVLGKDAKVARIDADDVDAEETSEFARAEAGYEDVEDVPEEEDLGDEGPEAEAAADWKEPDLAYVLKQAQEIEDEEAPEEDAEAETALDDAEEEAEAEADAEEDEVQDAIAAPTPDAPAPAVTHPVAAEPAAAQQRQDPPKAPEETLDLAAFAREQMRAAGLAAAPVAERPALDLSKPQTMAAEAADPVAGLAGRRAGRVKTRLLGFNRGAPDTSDPFAGTQVETAIQGRGKFPVGWLVIVDGPGKGHSFAIFSGASMIGRGEDQVIKLDFGDTSISRQNHAAIAYDDEENKFYIGHGGKSNIIRLNARPVLSTEELHHTDLVRIGETTLRFVALCGKDFQWDRTGDDHAPAL